MRIKFTDSDCVYTRLEYREDKFILSDNDGNQIACYPKTTVKDSYDPRLFELIVLHNNRDDYTENSIFHLNVKVEKNDRRIGWIFPIQALFSSEHNYANDSFFQSYAFVAYYHLLSRINMKDDDVTKMQPEYYSLLDYYDDDCVICIFDKEIISEISGFSVDDYVVDLFRKGYSFTGAGNLVSKDVEKPEKNLNLKKISEDLLQYPVIVELFKYLIPKTYDMEFARFLILYQVIEIMLSAVFNSRFNSFVSQIKTDSTNLFDERDKLSEMVNEKRRIVWLFNSFTNVSSDYSDSLVYYCREYLTNHNKKRSEDETGAEDLYSVRCFLVHELYLAKPEYDYILREINNVLLDIVIEMLFSFKGH